jgi:hypothetical protein
MVGGTIVPNAVRVPVKLPSKVVDPSQEEGSKVIEPLLPNWSCTDVGPWFQSPCQDVAETMFQVPTASDETVKAKTLPRPRSRTRLATSHLSVPLLTDASHSKPKTPEALARIESFAFDVGACVEG